MGLTLLIYMTVRGVELLIAAPLCALFVAATSGIAFFPQLATEGAPAFTSAYMGGFVGFVQAWFFMFLLGSLFGKVMEASGAADAVAAWIVRRTGPRHAALADLPRRFIPGALAFGSVTFTMTSAGSPEIQNWIPIKHLGTTPYAAAEVSLIVAAAMALGGYLWLRHMIQRAVATGERFEARAGDPAVEDRELPALWRGALPLLVVLVVSFVWHDSLKESALILSLGLGVVAAILLNLRHLAGRYSAVAAGGALGALVAIANTAAVVGFGSVAKLTAGFQAAVAAMTTLPGEPLIGAALAVSVIAGLTGSASGGQSIALPLIAPHYLDMGVEPESLHRVVSISSGALDSLPHNGYVVTTLRGICKETYAAAYPAVGALTVIVPALGTLLAVLLLSV